jgi:hypothetical protein
MGLWTQTLHVVEGVDQRDAAPRHEEGNDRRGGAGGSGRAVDEDLQRRERRRRDVLKPGEGA